MGSDASNARIRPPGPLAHARIAVPALLALGVLALLSCDFPGATSSASHQPLQFDHKVHVEQEEALCEACHTYFKTSRVAGRPHLSACLECHDEDPLSDSPEETKLIRFIRENREPPWVRQTRLPSHVQFSHQRHVTVAGVDCSTCHGDIAKLTVPPVKPLVSVNMEFCLDCHRTKRIQLDANSIKALRKDGLDKDLVEDLKMIQNKKFTSSGDLLAAVEKLSSTTLTDGDKKLVLDHAHPSSPVSVDCIACHL